MTAVSLLDFDEHRDLSRWAVAAAVVVAGHVGAVASYMLLHDPEASGSPMAPIVIIDFSPLPAAPASEQDIAVGPPQEEVKTEPEPPKEMPVTTELEQLKPEPKPQVKPPAPRTTAAPRNPAHTASLPTAPAPGSNTASAVPPSWINVLFSHLLRYRQYPSSARDARQEGTVTVNFTMDRNGRVLSRHLVKSSGYAALDAEALAMIERAQPLPAFPPQIHEASKSFTAPIKFSLR